MAGLQQDPDQDTRTVVFQKLTTNKDNEVLGYRVRPIPVDHTVEAAALIVSDGGSSIAYSGDTGPTEALWKALADQPDLRALIMEVAFPN